MPPATPPVPPTAAGVRLGTAPGRWVLAATVLGSGMAFLDATVVNIALPRIGEDFDARLAALQWTVNAYTLTLAGLLLLGGALGDRLGRRRVFQWGVAWFTVASVLCALAPTVEVLIAARALQGVGAALLTPGSLAIIEAAFVREDRGAAIGAWSGLGGIATALGPFLGGYMIDAVSWRMIFLINVPLGLAVMVIAARHVPETRGVRQEGARLDLAGAALAALGLAALTWALTEAAGRGWGDAAVLLAALVGAALLAGFVLRQARARAPMVPLSMFRSRGFSASNAVTFVVYAALSASLFLVPIQLQQVTGYSALQAGAALFPLTLVMLVFSARAGRLAQRIGPRLPMSLGPLLAGAGMAGLARVGDDAAYLVDLLPPLLVYAAGLALTVAPLTATVMASAPEQLAGIASAVNNTVARVAGLIAVALVPVLAGISGADYRDPAAFSDGYQRGILIAAALSAAGGVLALLLVPGRPEAEAPVAGEPEQCAHCALDAPPLRQEVEPGPA